MKKVLRNTFFKPEFMHAIVSAPTLALAKVEATKAVKASEHFDKPGINTKKAIYLIATVRTQMKLIEGITNFFLKHEGLGVNQGR